MGGAMAPAAVDTIERHFQDLQIDPSYYDLIVTGDLATIGRNIALDLFQQKGLKINEDKFNDCGLLIYKKTSQYSPAQVDLPVLQLYYMGIY